MERGGRPQKKNLEGQELSSKIKGSMLTPKTLLMKTHFNF